MKLVLGCVSNFQWAVSKPYIWICLPCRFVEDNDEGVGFCNFTCLHQYIDWIQGSTKFIQVLSWVGKFWSKRHKGPLG